MLNETYSKAENETKEVIYFVEQVTGHVIPDFRTALKVGVDALIEKAKSEKGEFYEAAELFRHFLVFYNVGDRSWAISQNVLISGRDLEGNDLTNTMSYAIMDAYFDMNLPQPILSVKLHKNTPEKLYREMGRFFFSAGVLTPSLFNDDALLRC